MPRDYLAQVLHRVSLSLLRVAEPRLLSCHDQQEMMCILQEEQGARAPHSQTHSQAHSQAHSQTQTQTQPSILATPTAFTAVTPTRARAAFQTLAASRPSRPCLST